MVAVLLVTGLVVKWQQARIGAVVFQRAVDARVGRDATAGLPDGLHVALCGTGSPLPNPARAGPCNVIIAGKHVFVVDAGEGAGRNINLMGLPLGRIEGVFLTHFHSDHIDGLGPLMMMRWTSGTNSAPLPIHGPPGVDRVVAGFNAAYAIDDTYRTGHHGPKIAPPTGAGGIALPFALPEAGRGDSIVVLELDGLKVTAFRVDHGPVKPAVGYRFDYKGRSLVLSGDTAKSANGNRCRRGVPTCSSMRPLQPRLVAAMSQSLAAKGSNNLAQIMRDIVNYHTTPEQAAEVAKAAGVKELVLSHIVPAIPNSFFYPAFLGDAASRFDGPIVVGEDGLMFSLPAGTTEIKQTRLM